MLKKAGDFLDSKSILADLRDAIYYSAVDDYHNGDYSFAKEYFDKIDPYLDSSAYLSLCNFRFSGASYSAVESLIGFEDASELIMSNQFSAEKFLLGSWKGDGRYFRMKDDGGITYDIPWINYGDFYRIEDGKVVLYKEKTPDITKNQFAIKIISNDCITIFSYKNGRTYMLFRQ